jgi:hypothetical protein
MKFAIRRPPQRVEQDEELDQVLVDRRARGLHDEHVVAAHRVLDLDVDLPVREPVDPGVGERDADLLGDEARQLRVRIP